MGREYHTATLLADGRVLVACGGTAETYAYPYTNTAELYDPATGTWTFTGSLHYVRSVHTATLLPNGKGLVAGGWPEAVSTGSAELYDPATGTWTFTGDLNIRHAAHTATLLFDGRVLVAGGTHSFRSVELAEPSKGTGTATASLTTPRYGDRTATLAADG